MTKFAYTARHPTTLQKTTGVVRTATLDQARTLLRGRNLVVSHLKEAKPGVWEKLTAKKVDANEIITFLSLMEGALSSGLSVKETLTVLQKQTQNPALNEVLQDVLESIEEGADLSASFAKHDNIFPSYFSPMVRAGEASGMLIEILRQMTYYMEKVTELKKKVIGMFIYPSIVLSFSLLLVGVMITFVVPRFEKVFAQLHTKLPPPTQILIGLSNVVKRYPTQLMLGFVLAVLGALIFYRTPLGKRRCHYALLKFPLFGKFFVNLNMINIVQTLGILLRSGLPVLEALQIVQRSISNIPIRDLINEMRSRVIKGLTLSEPLIRASDIIPPIVSYSVAVGEKNGNLPELLTNLNRLLERDLDHTMKRVSAVIDPSLTMVIGGIVLFIALAVYLPIFDSMANLAQ